MAERPDEVRRRDSQEEGPPESTPNADEELRERARSGDEVAAARVEVEQARTEVTETADAIQERLDPQRLKEEAKGQAGAAARSRGQQVLETIRDNSMLVTVVAGGVLGLVLLRRLRGQDSSAVVIDLRSGKRR